MIKGTRGRIFKHDGADYSNHGISSRCNEVTIVTDTPKVRQDEATALAPAVRIIARTFGNRTIYHAEPVDAVDGNSVGYMAGGTYINIDQIDVPGLDIYGLIPLHDRVETVEQYAAFSR